jgi:hypothetical protein
MRTFVLYLSLACVFVAIILPETLFHYSVGLYLTAIYLKIPFLGHE